MDKNYHGLQTTAIHAGEEPDPAHGAIVTPLYLATTFHFGSTERGAALFTGEEEGYVYTRWGNPTISVLEKRVAALEGAEAGLATASGMAAIVTSILANAKAGDHLVAAKAIYPSAYHLLDQNMRALGIETTFVDATDPQNVADALGPNTRVVYLETPGNPLLALSDLEMIGRIARAGGAISICDNTFATPVNQQPIRWGIDVVIHSATKYLNGHGDAIGGMILGKRDFIARARTGTLIHLGGVLSPFNSYLILRGTETLPLRVREHNANAFAVASFLEGHRHVNRVSYPGLPSHPQHALAKKQMTGYGGMISFEVKGGLQGGARLMDRVKLCALATSLGDVRTLISHPASTTHSVISRESRELQGVTDGLVRLSVGLEDVQDIIADLDQGLDE
jgi:methionine-gamma-lyase